uniref:Uncharacterized protein n=1 Tax=Pyrodinium bahamense TaxID=73915 RepID=A0A7S0AKY3_9DINO|mmetsp:Transcript_3666/g.10071  ORF Transcript_3666/g.10071 Transcript_3666/m.10071 type:complete len:205 (+) Transcript_3666:105-719(+)
MLGITPACAKAPPAVDPTLFGAADASAPAAGSAQSQAAGGVQPQESLTSRLAAKANDVLLPMKRLAMGANEFIVAGVARANFWSTGFVERMLPVYQGAQAATTAAQRNISAVGERLDPAVKEWGEAAQARFPETFKSMDRAGEWVQSVLAQGEDASEPRQPLVAATQSTAMVPEAEQAEDAGTAGSSEAAEAPAVSAAVEAANP